MFKKPTKLEPNPQIYDHKLTVQPSALLPLYKFVKTGNTKGGSITVVLTSCLTGLD
jgi:hypothetical protein